MNKKTIIEFGFRTIQGIMEISKGVIRLGQRPRRLTPSSISIILQSYFFQKEFIGELIVFRKLNMNFTIFLTRGYARAYHELLQGQRYANESLTHS